MPVCYMRRRPANALSMHVGRGGQQDSARSSADAEHGTWVLRSQGAMSDAGRRWCHSGRAYAPMAALRITAMTLDGG